MQAEERQKRIEEYLQQVEFASLEELAEQVEASVSTVRRDVGLLETGGSVRRTHGGARLVNPRTDEFVFNARDTHQLAEKEVIGRLCADLVLPGQTVIIDAGTTAFHVARYLEPKKPQIITNSLPVANLFASAMMVETIVTGGVLYPRLGVLVGPVAVETLGQMHADVAIMGAGGITGDGVFNSHALLIDIQRAMMRAARKVILCLDHTKFGRRTVARLCDLAEIDVLVTDAPVGPEIAPALDAAGIEVTHPRPDPSESPLPETR
ncbi:MAG: DeoR/GlpR transcriptional regulator [Verrucomicrobiales bacterium]|nr:DeoR/GlpR transcriptional regulator [Verrucomicrobiales bacterium]